MVSAVGELRRMQWLHWNARWTEMIEDPAAHHRRILGVDVQAVLLAQRRTARVAPRGAEHICEIDRGRARADSHLRKLIANAREAVLVVGRKVPVALAAAPLAVV